MRQLHHHRLPWWAILKGVDERAHVLPFPQAPDGIELRHLRAFVAVAEELNFSRAADRLYVSQPALSRQIRSLEQLVGCQLLKRSSGVNGRGTPRSTLRGDENRQAVTVRPR